MGVPLRAPLFSREAKRKPAICCMLFCCFRGGGGFGSTRCDQTILGVPSKPVFERQVCAGLPPAAAEAVLLEEDFGSGPRRDTRRRFTKHRGWGAIQCPFGAMSALPAISLVQVDDQFNPMSMYLWLLQNRGW